MAPVVHGLEKRFEGQVDFLYLNVAQARNDSAKRRFGFQSTPHFFLVDPTGKLRQSMQGVVPQDSLAGALRRLVER
jgi:thioredoxin-related protein